LGAFGTISPEEAAQALAILERGWVENAGQWDEKAAFAAPGQFGSTWVTRDGELRHVATKRDACERQAPGASEREFVAKRSGKPCPTQSWVLSERWVGGRVQTITGQEELQTKVSYFLGNDPAKHRSGLATYRYVSLGEVWPGVEVKLKASQKRVEKLFFLSPKAEVSRVQVELQGGKRLRLSRTGEILVETDLGELALSKPVAWQEKNGKKLPVEASYQLLSQNRYGFVVEGRDPTQPLVIDPILQSTYLGGSNLESATALAVAPSGNVYVTGYTWSNDFPQTTGGAQGSFGGGTYDAFLAQFNADLTSNPRSTYLGGSSDDAALTLTIASNGEVYVAGWTVSPDFPNTHTGAQGTNGGYFDAFVARLSPDLTLNPQSTYLGGSGADAATALAISSGTNPVLYVVGSSGSMDFPKTFGGSQAVYGGGSSDAFAARLTLDLPLILQSSYLGGSGAEDANSLAISPPPNSDLYVVGWTNSTDFPNTAGGAQSTNAGGEDIFVTRLSPTLQTGGTFQSTYLGGIANDRAWAVATPSATKVLVAGETASSNFPNTTGGAQAGPSGLRDAFVAELNATLSFNPQSTYLGGSGNDWVHGLRIGGGGEVFVAGYTFSTDFPSTSGGAQASNGGGFDAFLARIHPALTSIAQSTYLGGKVS
jgi:hypothetical protein